VADIVYLAAEGAPQVFRPPLTATRGHPPEHLGYNFDGIAPETLRTRVSVKDGRLMLPDGMSYRVLILPERETMTPALLRRVKELVEAGAWVVGPPPRKSPSLSGHPQCDEDVRRIARELWGDCDGITRKERLHSKGRVLWERTRSADTPAAQPAPEPEQYGDFAFVAGVLGRWGVPPDFESDGPLRHTHRRAGGMELYFVANPEDLPVEANCVFRVADRTPELWDPLTGERRDLPQFTVLDGRTTVPMRFQAAQSFFVVFRSRAARSPGANPNFPDRVSRAGLSGPWEVAFDPRWGGPGRVLFRELEDWRKRPETGIKFYSGKATYRQSFDAPSLSANERYFLDLGVVKNLAQVRLNGRDLGTVWCAPWRVEVTGALKAEGNELEVTVANLWPNRLIGDQALPAEKRFTSTTWNPFKADSPLLESGLLGPVTIQSLAGGAGPAPR
jgi:hypothetical protein